MVLDVILPTFNRQALLGRTLESLRLARSGRTERAGVGCRQRLDGRNGAARPPCRRRFAGRLHFLFERTPGEPFALNAGIAATDGDLIGLIDDDEEVDGAWFECIWQQFAAGGAGVDFIGGKCLPRWESTRPSWLGGGYLGVIGWVDPVTRLGPWAMATRAS